MRRILWNDLLTSDPEGAKTFYTSLMGWSAHGEASYTALAAEGMHLGGILPLGDEGEPHWLPHFSEPDLEASLRRLAFVQGSELLEPQKLSGVGVRAVVADPSGAVLALVQTQRKVGSLLLPSEGVSTAAWLLGERPDLGSRTYGMWMDWKTGRGTPETLPMKEGRGVVAWIGCPGQAARWVPTFHVNHLDERLERAGRLGAQATEPAKPLGKRGPRGALVCDPQGAWFALVELP